MNQRMIELYKQAQEFAYKNISKEYWNTDNFHAVVSGKFAELIVRDCLAQVARVDDMLEDEPAQTAAVAWAGSAIAEHFGVEE